MGYEALTIIFYTVFPSSDLTFTSISIHFKVLFFSFLFALYLLLFGLLTLILLT